MWCHKATVALICVQSDYHSHHDDLQSVFSATWLAIHVYAAVAGLVMLVPTWHVGAAALAAGRAHVQCTLAGTWLRRLPKHRTHQLDQKHAACAAVGRLGSSCCRLLGRYTCRRSSCCCCCCCQRATAAGLRGCMRKVVCLQCGGCCKRLVCQTWVIHLGKVIGRSAVACQVCRHGWVATPQGMLSECTLLRKQRKQQLRGTRRRVLAAYVHAASARKVPFEALKTCLYAPWPA